MTPDHPVILYVEDDPMSLKVMRFMLTRQLHLPHVTFFADSENFIERVSKIDPPPDLIFLDIHVPPIDGLQMLKLLRADSRFAPVVVVALTASVMNEEIALLREAGFDGCLAKPLDSASLPDLMSRLLRGEKIWRILG